MKIAHLCVVLTATLALGCDGDLGVGEDGDNNRQNNVNNGNNSNNLNNANNQADMGMNNMPDMGGPTRPSVASGNQLNQDDLFTCTDQVGASPARLRRVMRHEWTRNVGRWIGSEADKNPFDPLPTHQYGTYAENESINESVLDIYLDTVRNGTDGWATRNRYSAGALSNNVDEDSIACMYDEGGRPDATCVETWTRYFLERGAYFRPPTDEEVDALVAFAETKLDAETDPTARRQTLEQIVSAGLMTSGALFRTEMGSGAPDADGRQKLTDWELGNSIAYALDGQGLGSSGVYARFGIGWTGDIEGRLPLIRQAAIDGSISDPAKIEEIVAAYYGGTDMERQDLWLVLRDERKIDRRGEYWMATGILDFFQQWLGYPEVTNAFKDTPSATSFYGNEVHSDYGNLISGYYGHEPTLIQQMDDMIARVVAEDDDVFRNLLTTRTFYVPATAEFAGSSIDASTEQTSYIYGVTDPVQSTRADRWRTLPSTERAGVLTHPAWLSSHALAFENDPNVVHRGKWVREQLLCLNVPDVPITVEAAFDPDTRDQSARQRMTEQVDSRPQECGACHSLMNPLGYPFEIYNHAGYLRQDDHGSAPNGSAMLENMPDPALDGPVRDAVELSEKLADSDYTKRCFIRQTFRYFSGREEEMSDACTMTQMEQAYDDSNGSFSAMLTALFQSDSYQYRVIEEEEEAQ